MIFIKSSNLYIPRLRNCLYNFSGLSTMTSSNREQALITFVVPYGKDLSLLTYHIILPITPGFKPPLER